MKRPKHFNKKLSELKLVSANLNTMLEDGSFYRLSFWKRLKLINQVKRLYNSLLGSISSFKLKNILAAASILVFAVGCPDSGG
jgi:hypothetical protein